MKGKDKITMLLKSCERFKPLQICMQMLAQLLKCNVSTYCIGCGPSNQTYIKRIRLNLNTKIKCILIHGHNIVNEQFNFILQYQ